MNCINKINWAVEPAIAPAIAVTNRTYSYWINKSILIGSIGGTLTILIAAAISVRHWTRRSFCWLPLGYG